MKRIALRYNKRTRTHSRSLSQQLVLFLTVIKIYCYCFYLTHCFFDMLHSSKWLCINSILIDISYAVLYEEILAVSHHYSKIIFYIFAKSIWSIKDLVNILFNKMFLIFSEIKKVIFNRDSFFVNDYWFILCHCIRVKRKLNIVFHSQIDEQTKRQN